MKEEWFKDWFSSKEYLNVYSHRNATDAKQLIDLILNNIRISKNAKILDAACGAGRHSVMLASKGFTVTAFDLSKPLLEIAINEAKSNNLSINFINSDLRNFSSDEKYDLVLSLFTSFGYFNTDEENFHFIKKAYMMLNKSGFFVLDFLNSDFIKQNLVPVSEKIINDKRIIEKRKIENGRVIKEINILSDNRKQNYIESVKLYSYNELLSNFKKIGFSKIQTFGNYSGENFDQTNSKRCIIFFQK